jgi:hypothetical protein
VQTFAHVTAAKPDFVQAVQFSRVAAVAHIVNYEYSHFENGEERFPCPFLYQMRRRHHQPTECLPGAVDEHAAEGNQGFASTTLGNHIGVASRLPSFADSHDGQGLRRIRRPQHLRDQWRKTVARTMQRGVRGKFRCT